eukprot:9803584-Heterocapsa_arctica.AAC.1
MEEATLVPSTFDIFLGNITTWGTKAEHYCTSNSFPDQVLPAHHLQCQKLQDAKGSLGYKGYKVNASEATPSSRSSTGTHGGVMLLSRRHLKHVDAVLDDTSEKLSLTGHDWASTVIRLKGITLHIVGLYLTS